VGSARNQLNQLVNLAVEPGIRSAMRPGQLAQPVSERAGNVTSSRRLHLKYHSMR
jgi:hypothetical protein